MLPLKAPMEAGGTATSSVVHKVLALPLWCPLLFFSWASDPLLHIPVLFSLGQVIVLDLQRVWEPRFLKPKHRVITMETADWIPYWRGSRPSPGNPDWSPEIPRKLHKLGLSRELTDLRIKQPRVQIQALILTRHLTVDQWLKPT